MLCLGGFADKRVGFSLVNSPFDELPDDSFYAKRIFALANWRRAMCMSGHSRSVKVAS